MALDKKARGGSINFILPTRLGDVQRVENVSADMVRAALAELTEHTEQLAHTQNRT